MSALYGLSVAYFDDKKKLYVMNIFNFLSNLSVTHKRKNLEFISIFLSLKEG